MIDSATTASPHAPPIDAQPTVIITGPPWPRSGSGRVIQSQIRYYHSRGFRTVFIAVPFRWNFFRDSPVWDEFRDGLNAMGADHIFLAAIEPNEFRKAKYATTLRHGLGGTALDWIIGIAGSAQLNEEEVQLLRGFNVALINVNHVFTLGFALKLKGKLLGKSSQLPIILDTHDIQAHVVRENGEINPWTRGRDSERRLLRSEIKHLKAPDVLVHLSTGDFDHFQRALPSARHFLILPTIDEEFVSSLRRKGSDLQTIDLLFVADWHAPNIAAVRWFFEEVWPFIAARNFNLQIVGRIALGVQRELTRTHAEFRRFFVGEVADLAPYYRDAKCVIAPMVSGTGISIKTIEALGAGKPFVGTSKAFRGMPLNTLNEFGIRAYDDPHQFADAIVAALADQQSAEQSIRAAYDALFSAQACYAQRDEALKATLGDRGMSAVNPGLQKR